MILCQTVAVYIYSVLIIFCYALTLVSGGPPCSIKTVYSPNSTCNTAGCVHAASHILRYMDNSIDPCDDFYGFVCGTFLRRAVIPEDHISTTAFVETNEEIKARLKSLFEREPQTTDIAPFRIAKLMYAKCMHTLNNNSRNHLEMQTILTKLGGWPLLQGSNWNGSQFNLITLFREMRELGFSHKFLIKWDIGRDTTNLLNKILHLEQPDLLLERDVLLKGIKDKSIQRYLDYMVKVAVLLGANETAAREELYECLQFGIKLAKISHGKNAYAKVVGLTLQIDFIQKLLPAIDWLQTAQLFVGHTTTINSTEIILLRSPAFLGQFNLLISETPKRTLVNYIFWNIVDSAVRYLGGDVWDAYKDYSKTKLSVSTKPMPHWKYCVTETSNNLQIAASAMYVREFTNNPELIPAVEQLVNNIKREFQQMLLNVEWMDNKTQQAAYEKSKAMYAHISHPIELTDDSTLEKYYKNLNVTADDSYLNATMKLSRFLMSLQVQHFRDVVNKTAWYTHSAVTLANAFYAFTENSIQIPAGILQGRFFKFNRTQYLNYGMLGYLIGHEISHGFDNIGKSYDQDGQFRTWWDRDTENTYMDKLECIIEQYNNISENNVKINGTLTQGENIADNGGIKAAYYAYQSYVQRHGPEPKLPALDFNSNQLFWISAGNMWCSKYRADSIKNFLLLDAHSPEKYRVNIPFSNMDEFSKDFNCETDSQMNPKDKCMVW